jgi:hypothetical protein
VSSKYSEIAIFLAGFMAILDRAISQTHQNPKRYRRTIYCMLGRNAAFSRNVIAFSGVAMLVPPQEEQFLGIENFLAPVVDLRNERVGREVT